MSTPAVLVIGASGNVGSALINELMPDHEARLLRLVAATRKPEVAGSLRERGIEVRHLDLDDAGMGGLGAIRPSFEGIDRVFLLTTYDVKMLAQSKVAVDAAKAAEVSHIVHLGAGHSDPNTIEYAAWHELIEAYIERSGLGYTHVWSSAFLQMLPMSVAAPGVLTHFIGDGRGNWVDIGDVAAVAAAALRDPKAHDGRAYHVAAESASITEIADALGEITGQPWRYEQAKPQVFYDQLVAGGFDPIYMRGVRDYMERIGNGSLTDPTGVYDTIETVTGRPATSVRQFLERHRDLFQR
jgi:NAD(P)H dehydrogenase (quinone)